MSGLLAEEESVAVQMRVGRNELLVRAVNVWMNASTWAMHASIEPAGFCGLGARGVDWPVEYPNIDSMFVLLQY
jgi:hypothetical protein